MNAICVIFISVIFTIVLTIQAEFLELEEKDDMENERITGRMFDILNPSSNMMLSPQELMDFARICLTTFGMDDENCLVLTDAFVGRMQIIRESKSCFTQARMDLEEHDSTNVTSRECLSIIQNLIE